MESRRQIIMLLLTDFQIFRSTIVKAMKSAFYG